MGFQSLYEGQHGWNRRGFIVAFVVNLLLFTFEGSNSVYADGINSDWTFFVKFVILQFVWWAIIGFVCAWVIVDWRQYKEHIFEGADSGGPHMVVDVEKFVSGLFANMVTRRQGKIAEILIQTEELFDGPDSIHHDLRDNVADNRIEVKCSKVQEKHTETLTSDNFITHCLEHDPANRPVNYDEREDKEWGCNIQQIKRTEFEKLFYVLFFKDRVCVFCIGPDEITEDQRVNYCPTQHGGGEKEKEEGQFHVTNNNINHHIETYLHNEYTYEKFIQLFED